MVRPCQYTCEVDVPSILPERDALGREQETQLLAQSS